MKIQQNEFNKLLQGLLASIKTTHDLTNILEHNTLSEIQSLTENEGGYFLNSNDVVDFVYHNKDKIINAKFYIIAGYDITSNKIIIRFKHVF